MNRHNSKWEDTLTNIPLSRRDFLAFAGATFATSTLPGSLRAASAREPIKFGFPNASWGGGVEGVKRDPAKGTLFAG